VLILSDLDDTLLDDGAATSLAVDALAAELGVSASLPEFRSRWFASRERQFARFTSGECDFQQQRRARVRESVRSDLSDADADRTFDIYLSAYEQSWQLFPDVVPCLDALMGHTLGIVTNGSVRQQRRKLARTGILDRFMCVVASEELGCAKPDPRIFTRACELSGVAASDALHVGDNHDVDVVGAQRAGLRAVWLQRRSVAPTPRQSDMTCVTSLAALARLVTG
jgi:putative hydrolase of the HAD superfamily